ncbi:hypothetical protein GCM10027085_44690 [Spirosoma aerophilum]
MKEALKALFERYEFSRDKSGLHTFFALIPNDSNPDKVKFEAHYTYWLDTFGSTVEKNDDLKGIIKINFS